MRAQDATYYNIKQLHAVFAVSAVLFLAATVWMLVADHYRPWKRYQRTFRDRVEPWGTEAALGKQQTEAFHRQQLRLLDQLAAVRRHVPEKEPIEQFCRAIEEHNGPAGAKQVQAIGEAFTALRASPSAAARDALLTRLRECIDSAVAELDQADRQVRFARARWDEARSRYELALGRGASEEQLQRLQRRVDRLSKEVAERRLRRQQRAAFAERLKEIYDRITAEERQLRDAVSKHRAEVDRLTRLLEQQRPSWIKRLLRFPVIDALGRQLQVRQIWLPELPIDYHFARVARFDRCTTCHAGIDKTVLGHRPAPAWPVRRELVIYLPVAAGPEGGLPSVDRTADSEKPPGGPATGASEGFPPTGGTESNTWSPQNRLLLLRYGFAFAQRGVLDDRAATVGLVIPGSAAAEADLRPGDAILAVEGTGAADRLSIAETLLGTAPENGVWALRIRRGLPHPFAAHPRIDLYVGASSPHPASRFGCTVCHDGQGSATAFAWASHTPNDPQQRRRWQRQLDWFENPHWPYPMRPRRLLESNCLKCHHDPLELESPGRFPRTAAGKLLAGYRLVLRYGCFGCHQIRGTDGRGRPIGPDLRLEPNYHEAAAALLAEERLTETQRRLAIRVVSQPDDAAARRRLVAALRETSQPGAEPADTPAGASPRVARRRTLVRILAQQESAPGTLRKNGPSLRHLAEKLDADFLRTYLGNPQAFRPETRMPRLFGLHAHLDGESRRRAERFEAVEIRGIVAYLLDRSRPSLPARGVQDQAHDRVLPGSPDRGKRWFVLKGCAACHKHQGVPEALSTFGPDLSALGRKLNGPRGKKWLSEWIRNPARYWPRTPMPQLVLEPLPAKAAVASTEGPPGGEEGAWVDPVADLVAFLLPPDDRSPANPVSVDEAALDQLVQMYLERQFPAHRAKQFAATGIPPGTTALRGDAEELIGPPTTRKKLRFVGRATIRRRGCFGCHEIPGFENAEPIGPALTGWARKGETLLAFEQVHRFVEKGHTGQSTTKQASIPPPPGRSGAGKGTSGNSAQTAQTAGNGSPGNAPETADTENRRQAFFHEALLGHRREGFLWQKLSAPRSFDYGKAHNKDYLEWLTMGQFSFTEVQREAIATFVLGLVGEPVPNGYLPQPSAARRAKIEGRRIIEKYGCAECHLLELPRWEVVYDPHQVEGPVPIDEFAFLKPLIDRDRLDRTTHPDRRGLLHAQLVGMPEVDPSGALVEDVDDDDYPLYFFNLWEDTPLRVEDHWEIWSPGSAQMAVSDPFDVIDAPPGVDAAEVAGPRLPGIRPSATPHLWLHRPAEGGAFARLLLPRVADRSAVSTTEAWSRVPPPLVREGRRVRPEWLYDYLLNPTPIRPAVVLGMPKYNFAPREAELLVAYFAAKAAVEYPYHSLASGENAPGAAPAVTAEAGNFPTPASPPGGDQARSSPTPFAPDTGTLDAAFRILTDRKTFCAKCHLIGDWSPGNEVQTTLAPPLDRAGKRIRAEYLRRWIAHPKRLLPYTGMPVNFPPAGPPVGQDLFPATSLEQLDAMVDLLLHYDAYLQQRLSIRRLIEQSELPSKPAGAGSQ